jgi:hypothetical protein
VEEGDEQDEAKREEVMFLGQEWSLEEMYV